MSYEFKSATPRLQCNTCLVFKGVSGWKITSSSSQDEVWQGCFMAWQWLCCWVGCLFFFFNWRKSVGETELALVSIWKASSVRCHHSVGVLWWCLKWIKIGEAINITRLDKCQPVWPVSLKTSTGKPHRSGCNAARQREGASLSWGVSESVGGTESFIFYIL